MELTTQRNQPFGRSWCAHVRRCTCGTAELGVRGGVSLQRVLLAVGGGWLGCEAVGDPGEVFVLRAGHDRGSLQDRQVIEGKDLRPCHTEYRLPSASAATSTSSSLRTSSFRRLWKTSPGSAQLVMQAAREEITEFLRRDRYQRAAAQAARHQRGVRVATVRGVCHQDECAGVAGDRLVRAGSVGS
jgi:hypothetical protein